MLQLTTQFRYGLRTLVVLAAKSKDKLVPLKTLSKEQYVSKKYLEIIYRALGKAGITRGVKGVGGGYELSVSPNALTLLDIMTAVDGPINLLTCTHGESLCRLVEKCPTRGTWKELENHIVSFLKSKTLQDLVDDYVKSNRSFEGMFI